jgi:hypothetical protein
MDQEGIRIMRSYNINLMTNLTSDIAVDVKVIIDQIQAVHEANAKMHGPRRSESSGRVDDIVDSLDRIATALEAQLECMQDKTMAGMLERMLQSMSNMEERWRRMDARQNELEERLN